jgi:hypothetical protein
MIALPAASMIAKNSMTYELWTVRRPGEPELKGKFFASKSEPIAPADQVEISRRLGITLTSDTLFEVTSQSVDESFLPPEPHFRGESGRKYWVYQMDQQSPV